MLLKSNQFRLCLTNISMKRERNLTSFCGEMMDMRCSFEMLVNWQLLVWFKTMLHEQNRRLLSSWITLQKSPVVVLTEVLAFLKKLLYNLQSLQATVCSNQQRDTKNLPQKGNMVHLLLVFLRNDSKLNNLFGLAKKKYIRRFTICLISTDILIRSLNNNAFEKCTNGNAFNIVTISHFLVTLIQEHLEDLGCFLR